MATDTERLHTIYTYIFHIYFIYIYIYIYIYIFISTPRPRLHCEIGTVRDRHSKRALAR